MQIRNKLTYQFIGIVASVMLVATLTIYLLFAQFRESEWYLRLNGKATATARLLLSDNKVDPATLKLIDINLGERLREEKIIIFNPSGIEIYSTNEDLNFNITGELRDRIRNEREIHFKQGEFEWLGIAYRFQNNDYLILAGANDFYGFRKLDFLGYSLMSVFTLILISVYFFGRFFAGRALKPISKVISDMEKISSANLDARVDEGNGEDEIAQLARRFNKLLERIETAFKAQQVFVGNASHELRNPLSVIRGQLEVILLKSRDQTDYIKTVESVLEDIKNLTNISNRMLSLAQVSGGEGTDPKTGVRIDELLLDVRSELIEGSPEYNVNIEFGSELENDDLLIVSANAGLMKIAFYNLMENACKYSQDHTCNVIIDPHEKGVFICFKDNGIGIPQEDLKNIFEPFYRGKNVLDSKGHGIGLSLVDKIMRMHGGTVEVESKENVGTVFTVKLPV